MKEFPKKYNHKEAEKKCQQKWLENGVYHWRDDKPREETFVIDTPPPTVSGILHMGHVFSYTQADFIARYKRMKDFDVFYPMGFDDNGLPTERLVEKVKKIRASDMPREEFIKVCEEVVADAEKEFEELFNSLALSVDWRQKYMTISEQSRKISQLSFLDLYNKGEVERRHQPMFWDWIDQTAIATAEMEEKELDSFENYLYFQIEGGDKVEIMTTRPEMLPACVAVMYHPDDADKYEGKFAITPLFNVRVPMIADEAVDKEKGTGVVMCCTFGDEQDINWWRKHNLEMRIIINKYGKLEVEGELNGLKINAARAKTIELLEQGGHTAQPKKPIKHMVKCAERSGAALEIIPTEQWFVKIIDKKERIKEKINECNWHPSYMKLRAEQWTENLNWDWCISRQRYFGVPFPVWYKQDGSIVVAQPDELPVNPLVDKPKGYEDEELTPDRDVMDTWATSSVSPQLSAWGITSKTSPISGGIEGGGKDGNSPHPDPLLLGEGGYILDKNRYSKLFPADMRPQAHEIIRTWAFYTIVKALLHENKVPWQNLMISGWCLAEDKSKMSKSKGNVITPVPLIEEKSSDVVRYWASTSSLGADTAYSEDVLKIGNKLVNKLWNACKFASLNLGKLEGAANAENCTEILDKWILTKLNQCIKNAEQEFERFEYSKARQHIEDFFWNDFCDNYLEMVKTRSYGEQNGGAGQQSALNAISICVDYILRLWAPIVPHITEELHDIIFTSGESIHARGSWPQANLPEDESAKKAGELAKEALELVRKFKSDNEVSIKFPLKTLEIQADSALAKALQDLKDCTSSEEINLVESAEVKISAKLGEQKAA